MEEERNAGKANDTLGFGCSVLRCRWLFVSRRLRFVAHEDEGTLGSAADSFPRIMKSIISYRYPLPVQKERRANAKSNVHMVFVQPSLLYAALAAMSPLAWASNSSSLFFLSLTSALILLSLALLTLASSNTLSSSISSAVARTGTALVILKNSARISLLARFVISMLSVRVTGS